jgi:uncharacterized protein
MMRCTLKFAWVPGRFEVCRFPGDAPLPLWVWSGPLTSVTRTPDELSIVCAAGSVPPEFKGKIPWLCLKLEGPFSFSEVGILASFIEPLAESGVPIFAISTYDTDYVLVNEESAGIALQALKDAGHELLPSIPSTSQ